MRRENEDLRRQVLALGENLLAKEAVVVELTAKLSAIQVNLAAIPEEVAPAIPEEVAPGIRHELMLALAKLDDSELRREFDAHADRAAGAGNEGGRRMSKYGLANFMREKGLAHGDAQVERVMARADTNEDGEMDFGEFRALARANSEVEQVLRSMHLECLVAASFPSDTTLDKLGKMDDAQLSAVVDKSRPGLIQLLRDLRAQLAAAGSAQPAAEGGKFASELKGGTLGEFHEGVTGRCGEPDADLEAGMRKEHTELDDADVEFSTPNYGITTTARKEFELVASYMSGSSECEAAPKGGEGVVAKGTRGCFKASGLKWCKVSSDPAAPHFTLGLQWHDVGGAEPKEGRRLANAKLQDALHKLEGDVIRFAEEEMDAFDFTDLRSTDFIEAGGRYFQPAASSAQMLENAGLAEALTRQTEFTQQEWDAFGIGSLRMSHVVKAGGAYYRPAGTEERKDMRVLHDGNHYGTFGEDGLLKWGVGDEVVVGEVCSVIDGRGGKEKIPKDTAGKVLEINAEGAAKIAFRGAVAVEGWVPDEQFYRLHPLPHERDTPIQRRVKLGKLRRCEVMALVMYTGACLCVSRELCWCQKRMQGFTALEAVQPCRSHARPLIAMPAAKCVCVSLSLSLRCAANSADARGGQAPCLCSTTRCSGASASAARWRRTSNSGPTSFGRSARPRTSRRGWR